LDEVGVTSDWIERSFLAESNFKAAFNETSTVALNEFQDFGQFFEYVLIVFLVASLVLIIESIKPPNIRKSRRAKRQPLRFVPVSDLRLFQSKV